MSQLPTGPLENFVARATPDGYVPLGHGPDESHVSIDQRDEGAVQNLISHARMGATDLNVGLGRLHPGMYHLKHHHPHGAEFYYIITGRCTIHIAGHDVDATPGTAIYIPTDHVHAILNDSDQPVEFLYGLNKGDYSDIGLVYDE
jgi:mannose-6-phosphate isomerase-like protein (cupin superfamily)